MLDGRLWRKGKLKMENKNILDFYGKTEEHTRMQDNPLEFIRCKELISRYLPMDSSRILDIGGATGVFSFWMAGLGHSVDLVDFTPKHIGIAKKLDEESSAKLHSAAVGDARSLAFADGTFDVVVMMGPLYHLVERADRINALREARRVLRKGGVVVCEAISRYASTLDGFIEGLGADPDFFEILTRDLKTGFHEDTSKIQRYFTDAYFHFPQELVDEILEVSFELTDILSVEGFGHLVPDLRSRLQDDEFRMNLLSTIRLIERNRDIMGMSSHFMGIGTRS
jgi:ubiquinone/menaquinone biosynthesis C-methylase UbiE